MESSLEPTVSQKSELLTLPFVKNNTTNNKHTITNEHRYTSANSLPSYSTPLMTNTPQPINQNTSTPPPPSPSMPSTP